MKTQLIRLTMALPLILAAVGCATTAAQVAPRVIAEEGERPDLEHQNLDRSGLALKGYDPVSYFEEGGSRPRKGKAELSAELGGVIYRFATEENLDLFAGSPARFEPHYGGWCAYAMATGSKVEIDPKSYVIQDGRLLLFYTSFFVDTRKKWNEEPEKLGGEANEAWVRLIEPPGAGRE